MLSRHFSEELGAGLREANISRHSIEVATAILSQLDHDSLEVPGGIKGARRRLEREGQAFVQRDGAINLIPSPYKGACHELLLVISFGKVEFPERLKEAHDHCIRCYGITKGVIFASDYWDNDRFNRERRSTFEALNQQTGLTLVAALLAGDTWSVAPVIP